MKPYISYDFEENIVIDIAFISLQAYQSPQRCSRLLRRHLSSKRQTAISRACLCSGNIRTFHTSPTAEGQVVPFLLSDIGEGIREVNVKEW